MKFDMEIYKKMLERDREYTEEMVADEELTEEEGFFRDLMRMDEILMAFDD